MIEDFLKDHEHHIRVRILVICGRVLQSEYATSLKQQGKGQHGMVEYQAERAAGAFYRTILELFRLLDTERIFKLLDLRSPNLALDRGDPSLAKDHSRVECLTSFIVELAHARAWSQLHHALCFPHCFVRILSSAGAEETQSLFHRLSLCLKFVDKARREHPHLESVQTLVGDIGTLDWVLTREILSEGRREKWNPESLECIRQLAWMCFAGPAETKSCCESTFSWLLDHNSRQSKRNVLGGATKYMYTQICPYPKEGGMNPLKPTGNDLRSLDATDKKDSDRG